MILAVLGGKPAVPENSFYTWPNVTEAEVKSLVKKFRSLSLSNYKLDSDVAIFEKKFNEYIGSKYCLMLNSGTAAIYSALLACDIKPSDNVIIPAYSFFSAATAVLNVGAKVKFCDVDLETFNIDPENLNEQINKNTKVVILVHIFGNPCDMNQIYECTKNKNIILIEDACQAHGAIYKGKKAGNLGDIAAFSFHISKNLPIAEGGAITTNNLDLRDKAAKANMFPNYIQNKYTNLGHNFKFNGLFAAIGIERLKNIETYNQRRQENRDYLVNKLKKFDFIIPQKITEETVSSNTMFVFRIDHTKLGISDSLVDSRNRFLLALHNEGVHCGVWLDKTVPEMEWFKQNQDLYPKAKLLTESTIYISGIHYPNSKLQMDLIIKAIEKIANNCEELKKIK